MLTVRDREDDVVMGLECGADDYVRKPFSPRALVARIRALARRAAQNEATVLSFGELQLNLEAHTLSIGGTTEIHLTPLQLKALQLLMANNGRTVTAERLMAHLWGNSTRRERHSLKQLIHRLRDRLAQEARAPEMLLTTPHRGASPTSPERSLFARVRILGEAHGLGCTNVAQGCLIYAASASASASYPRFGASHRCASSSEIFLRAA
jgi:DNA-binding response OmpR family regulator